MIRSCDSCFGFTKENLYGPFLWMGFNCLKAAEPLGGGSLLFATNFHLINICSTSGRWRVEPTLELPSGFGHGTPGLGIQRLNHKAITSILYTTDYFFGWFQGFLFKKHYFHYDFSNKKYGSPSVRFQIISIVSFCEIPLY